MQKFLLFCFIALGTICGGCGSDSHSNNNDTADTGSGSTSTAITVKGSVTGNAYYADSSVMSKFLNTLIPETYATPINVPDKIVVFFDRGREQKAFDIDDEGGFEIDTSLFDEDDLVFLVVNSAFRKVFGHLNLNTHSDATLDFVDKSKLEHDLDLGEVDTENYCSSSVGIDSTTAFSSEALDELEKIAISDNALVLYQNIYRNPDYMAEIHALYNMPSIESAKEAFTEINEFSTSNLIGLRPVVATELSNFDDVDKDKIELYPPSVVRYTTARDGKFNTTADITRPVPATYKSADRNFYEFAFVDKFPIAGDWLLKFKEDTTTLGEFNFSAAYPYDQYGKSLVPVPQIKVNMDEDDKISSIDIKWSVFNGDTYEPISNAFMNSIATQENDDAEGGKFIAPLRISDGETIATFLCSTWNGTYVTSDNSSVTLPDEGSGRRINMSYYIGQASYQFMYQ